MQLLQTNGEIIVLAVMEVMEVMEFIILYVAGKFM